MRNFLTCDFNDYILIGSYNVLLYTLMKTYCKKNSCVRACARAINIMRARIYKLEHYL